MQDMAVALFVVVFGSILSLIEIPDLLKKKMHRELVAFVVLTVLGMSLALLKAFGWSIPNPSDLLAWVYSPVEGIIKGLLE